MKQCRADYVLIPTELMFVQYQQKVFRQTSLYKAASTGYSWTIYRSPFGHQGISLCTESSRHKTTTHMRVLKRVGSKRPTPPKPYQYSAPPMESFVFLTLIVHRHLCTLESMFWMSVSTVPAECNVTIHSLSKTNLPPYQQARQTQDTRHFLIENYFYFFSPFF